MNEEEKFSWTALEYEEREKSADWYWALGIIVITSSVTAIIFNNYFFAILLLLGGGLLFIFAKKKPAMISYALDKRGLHIGERVYPYENIKSFYLQKEDEHKKFHPTLFIKIERMFMPIFSIPIEDEWADGIRDLMLEKNIKEEEMKEHISEKIMESLGF